MIKRMLVEKLKEEKDTAIVVLNGYAGETINGVEKKGDLWCITGQNDHVGMPLTVKQLISALEGIEDNERIYLGNTELEELLYVMSCTANKHLVWLEVESDNDMGEELSAMFEQLATYGEDELVAYSDMLDQGITVEMVREYLGDEQADHMKEFCMEHGLLDEDEADEIPAKVFKVRLEHAVELFVRASSEEKVQDWLHCNTPASVKGLLEQNERYIDEDYNETILCECMGNSIEDITI